MTLYHGGKNRIGLDIATFIHSMVDILDKENGIHFQGYVEPFVGMAGVYRHISELFREYNFDYQASDINPSLILMWKDAQKGKSDKFPINVTQELFDKLKYDPKPSATKGLVGFANSYMGIYFTTFNVNYAKNTNTIKRVLDVGEKLENVQFSCCNYDKFSNLKNHIIYCDPPYSKSSNYYDEDHRKMTFDHDTFWKWTIRMANQNLVLVSEYEVPEKYSNNIIEVWKQISGKGMERLFLVIP